MMPDPMVTAQEIIHPSESKIIVKVDESSDLPAGQTSRPVTMEGEPQLSPPFRPDGDSASAAQRTPYMPVSDLTGIDQTSSAPKAVNKNSDNRSTITGPKPPSHRKPGGKFWLGLLVLLVALAAVYGAIDKGLILSNVNLPLHIFKQAEPAATSAPVTPSGPVIPSGFAPTKLVEANLSFAYPAAWGAPVASTDQGFSNRSTSAKADVNYAFLLNFPDNKDIQIAITSGKYLPPARATQYYDFLGWCLGSVDAKYYVGVLRFATANGVDTPTTTTCDQGPLNNVAKLNNDTIVQTNIKNADGGLLGDIYTKNLSDKSYVVARVKDATMKNSDLVKTMLNSFKPISQ